MTSFSEVRKGWGVICKAGIRLLASDGTEKNDEITNAIIESNADKFNSLMKQMGYDERLMARLIADAAKVVKIPEKAGQSLERLLYMEGLAEAERILKNADRSSYADLQEAERLKLAGFLFRPPEERTLTWHERVAILYPKAFEGVFGGEADFRGVLEIGEQGLRKVLRTVIEAGPLHPSPPSGQVETKWTERGWDEYKQTAPYLEDMGERFQQPLGANQGVITRKVSGYLPHYNLPDSIEYLLRDIINYLGAGLPYGKEERDLDKIVPEALKIMPHRKRLEELDYFHEKKTEGERHNMLQTILEGRALF